MLTGAGLTEKETVCLAHWCYDGKTQEEIAAITGRSRTAVKKSIARAQEKLSRLGMMARRLKSEPRQPTIAAVPNHEIESLQIAAVF